ncbi:geranylgeranyl diphosphate synthase type II [Microbacterium sp. AG1240]|uniref:polyprenyl synthetase family protein n=1 Tax=Microbacterium sp. AG1240 TaxID=2183992 RepID=UPI000F1B4A2A|nr:polyprenyl synthetase family protein [Microbacterium sp. AG1240]RKT36588.1 geranylgeranyl diphosphate synthase type II [Microbacterium sp. AG1240]
MITLPHAPLARAGIDAAIDASLRRLRERAAAVDPVVDALAASIERATSGGKRFRPALVVAAFETLGGSADETPALFPVAAAFELLHTAFVVHDDVIDHDTHRRGALNIAGEFRARGTTRGADAAGAALLGDAAGILAGDLLLHEATRAVALADLDPTTRGDLFELMDEAVLVSTAGELADVENSVTQGDLLDADDILLATANKTAVYSFSAPLEAGAVLAGAPTESRRALRRFGEKLGLGYQLVDDLIGAFGSAAVAGRREGGDLHEAKQTPLIALARQSEHWPEVADALSEAHTGPVAIRAAQRALAASGARARMEALVVETLDSARGAVDASLLPDATRTMLFELADAVQDRIP